MATLAEPLGGATRRAQARGAATRAAATAERARLRRYLPLLIHAPVVLIVWAVSWLWTDPVLTLRVGGGLVLVAFPMLAYLEGKRSALLLSPLSFYFLWYTTSLGAAALYIADELARQRVLQFSVTYLLREDLEFAYLIFMLGSLALHAGMQVVRPLPGEAETRDARRTPVGRILASPMGLLALWVVGVLSRASTLHSVLGSAGTILGVGSLAALCTLALRTEPHRRDVAFWILLALGVGVEFALNVNSGSKAFLMYSFIPLVWLLVWDRRLRRLLIPVGVALSIFYLTVISPVVAASRMNARADESRGDRIVETFLEGDYDRQPMLASLNTFLERQFDPMPVAFIVREVEHRGYLDGESLDYLAYAFIPRIVWPDKPAVTRGRWFNSYLLGDDRGSATNVGQTAVGELYWNFGLLGVVLGMAIIGALLASLWRFFGTTPHYDPVAMVGYLTLVFGMNNLTEAGTVAVSIVFTVAFFTPLFWFTRIFGTEGKRRPLPAMARRR